MKNQNCSIKTIGILISVSVIGILCCLVVLNYPLTPNEEPGVPPCMPLPESFSEADLVGTWIAEYSGGDSIDQLQLRSDGTYKQRFTGTGSINFESDWQKWSIEYHQNGYALLHLKGMRRCDGTLTQCNNPGGGLPEGDLVVNICEGKPMHYVDEVILFVIGSSSAPRGFELIHARAAGSDWNYSFRLDQ
jgi:hypothetical protein